MYKIVKRLDKNPKERIKVKFFGVEDGLLLYSKKYKTLHLLGNNDRLDGGWPNEIESYAELRKKYGYKYSWFLGSRYIHLLIPSSRKLKLNIIISDRDKTINKKIKIIEYVK